MTDPAKFDSAARLLATALEAAMAELVNCRATLRSSDNVACEARAEAGAAEDESERLRAENERLRTELEMIRDAAADAIRDNEHVGFTVRTLHVLRAIKLEETR